MSWLARNPSMRTESDGGAAFATEFGRLVDRAFAADDVAVGRLRAQVLGAFIEGGESRPRQDRRRHGRRRLMVGLAATVGLLVVSTAAVQARPGGAFYPLRMAIETATLASADLPAGWQARIERLGSRIDESLAAQRSDDPAALAASLTEYRSELAAMTDGLADPGRRSALGAAVGHDLTILLELQRTDPSDAAGALIADVSAFLDSLDPADGAPGGGTTGDPHPDDTTGNPHAAGTTGDPHADGSTGDPHADGTTGDPHADGTTGNPHTDGSTGDPHANGSTGNPHADGSTGNPHASGQNPPGNPHAGGKKTPPGNPHGGKGQSAGSKTAG